MERFIVTKKVGILGVIGNLFLFIIKIIIGLSSHSFAMIADSINSAGDIFASLMTWIGNKISSVPNDEDHNYGHGKAEYIFSMLISVSMIIVSCKMLLDSIISIVQKNKIIFSWNLIVVCIITIIIKLCLYLYTKKVHKKSNNLLVKANMIDHRNDCVITLFTLIAILLTRINIFWFDGVVGILISLWILKSGIEIFKDSYKVLMDSSIDSESKKIILNILKQDSSIKRIGHLYSIPIGCNYIVVITVFIDGAMSTAKSHKIVDKIEQEIINKIDIIEEVVIHIEPYFEKNKRKVLK